MEKRLMQFIACIYLSVVTTTVFAQVQGISYTFSPATEYTRWHDEAGISDGFLLGGQFGFGFGQYVELRGNYFQSLNLENNFDDYGFENFDTAGFTPTDVKLKRYGGELRLNLSKSAFKPYITIGTGIQSIGLDSLEAAKQIYVNAGAGVKVSVAKRYTLGIQAMNTGYRFNAPAALLTAQDITANNLDPATFEAKDLRNWSLRASLEFYIGGRNPNKMTAVDKAYLSTFSGGLKGLSLPVEPTVARINFSEDLGYRDTWLAGGSTGFDFGPYVGVRGFYYRGIEEDKVTDFDQIQLYGGEGRFKLGEGKGVSPTIMLGGGKIDVLDDYANITDTLGRVATDKGFAMGGIGLDFSFSKFVKLTGFAKALLTTNEDTDNLANPDQISTSWMYGASLNLIIGKNSKNPTLNNGGFGSDLLASNEKQIEKYDAELAEINKELGEAIQDGNIAKMEELRKQQAMTKAVIRDLEQTQKEIGTEILTSQTTISPAYQSSFNPTSEIRMSPAEFQNLLREIMDGKSSTPAAIHPAAIDPSKEIDAAVKNIELNNRLDGLTRMMEELKNSINDLQDDVEEMEESNEATAEEMKSREKEMLQNIERTINNEISRVKEDLNDIEDSVKETDKKVNKVKEKQIEESLKEDESKVIERVIIKEEDSKGGIFNRKNKGQTSDEEIQQAIDKQYRNADQKNHESMYAAKKGFMQKLNYDGASAFTGFNLGNSTTFNLGFRWHYKVANTKFTLMPETFFGFGSPSSFGISVNGIYELGLIKSALVKPYVGAGLGFLKTAENGEDALKGAVNLLVGTQLFKIMDGRLYADFTTRNFFKDNQIIVGYRLPF